MEFENQYLTFTEYKKLGGALDEPPFNISEAKVRKQIDRYTFGRLINLEQQKQETKLCMFELINTLSNPSSNNASNNKNISSESYPGYSVTYQPITEEVLKANKSEIKDIIQNYLSECKLDDGTPYLYRGVDKRC